MSFRTFTKKFLPQSLLGRTLLILVSPLVILQVVSTYVFYTAHWETMSRRLAEGLAGDVVAAVEFLHIIPAGEERERMLSALERATSLNLSFMPDAILPNQPLTAETDSSLLGHALRGKMNFPFDIIALSDDRDISLEVQIGEGVLHVEASRKRLYSSTTSVFILWMIGTSLLLFGIATLFLRNQIRAVRRLAIVAEGFGKGRDVPDLKPGGATEVRQVAIAFNQMRDRIRRQLAQRTEMLAGVSHDLRTPLTRMKLQLALIGPGEGIAELQEDIQDMERMIEAYLSFARGEGSESFVKVDLAMLLEEVVSRIQREGKEVEFQVAKKIVMTTRPMALGRSLSNLIGNATRYADKVTVRAKRDNNDVIIFVDDNGPGIPKEKREDVFKAFLRLEESRNAATGGVGLGMTVARDLVRGMGGDIELQDSPLGGLRALVRLPL